MTVNNMKEIYHILLFLEPEIMIRE